MQAKQAELARLAPRFRIAADDVPDDAIAFLLRRMLADALYTVAYEQYAALALPCNLHGY